jgi:hypothetical protein
VVADTGYDLGMGRLDEEGANTTDKGGGIADHTPGHRFGTEQTRIAAIEETAGQRVGGVAKGCSCRGHDA